jgi:hypothetical protein
MSYCLFLLAQQAMIPAAAMGEEELRPLIAALSSAPGLTYLVSHRAITGVRDPAIERAAGPSHALQLYFDELLSLEGLLTSGSVLDRALGTSDAPLRRHLHWCHQAMAVRRYQLPAYAARSASPGRQECTYFVSYEGRSTDDEEWLAHYLRHHPPIMAKLPDLRKLEVYSRLDYRSELDIEKARSLQRNIVVFDSQDRLNVALSSPVREELRADYEGFPRFNGTTPHRAMVSSACRRAPPSPARASAVTR